MRQNVEQPYTSTFITLAPKFTCKFTRWLTTDYRLTYTNNQYEVDAVKAIHSALRQNLSITFLPTDQWHIAFGAEHYFTRFSNGQTASITFLPSQNLCIPLVYDQEILSSKCKSRYSNETYSQSSIWRIFTNFAPKIIS